MTSTGLYFSHKVTEDILNCFHRLSGTSWCLNLFQFIRPWWSLFSLLCAVQLLLSREQQSTWHERNFMVHLFSSCCDHHTAKMGNISYLKWTHCRRRLQRHFVGCVVFVPPTAMCLKVLLWSMDVNISPLPFFSEPVRASQSQLQATKNTQVFFLFFFVSLFLNRWVFPNTQNINIQHPNFPSL